MTIGNMLSRTRSSTAKMLILLLAVLPVPAKFTGKSARGNEAQRQSNADVLLALCDLVLAPLQQVAREGTVMDCADGKTCLCFPILSAWIADHAEHAALQGIGSKSCPKWEVPCEELRGDPRRMYEIRHYMLYREKPLRHEPAEAASIAEYFQRLRVKIVTIYWWRIVDYWFSHCGVKAIECAKRIDSYLKSERKTIMRES